MYSDLSKSWKYLNRGVTSLAWASLAAVGVWVAIAPPGSIVERQDLWVSVSWCLMTSLGAVLALIGEIRGHYWTQLVGALVSSVGVSAYMLTVWAIASHGAPTRGAQAAALTALFFFTLRQAVLCGSQAYRVRKLHEKLPEV